MQIVPAPAAIDQLDSTRQLILLILRQRAACEDYALFRICWLAFGITHVEIALRGASNIVSAIHPQACKPSAFGKPSDLKTTTVERVLLQLISQLHHANSVNPALTHALKLSGTLAELFEGINYLLKAVHACMLDLPTTVNTPAHFHTSFPKLSASA